MKHTATLRNADYFGFDPIYFDFPCTIDFTRFGDSQTATTNTANTTNIDFPSDNFQYKVFVCCNEPSSSSNREHNRAIIMNSYQYDMILTTEDEVIENCDNAYFFPYGGTWLNKKKQNHPDSLGEFDDSILEQIQSKQFNVSFLTTSHLGKTGYNLRQHVWKNRDKIKIPTLFYSSTRFKTDGNSFVGGGRFSDTLHDGVLPNDDKINLFKSQFSIAIESSRENSYFTEKLIDCLLTKTVPVYWGCPNIGEFFDIRGIIHFKTHDEMIEKLNKIDENTYQSMLPYIEHNYEVAKEYGRSFFERIREKVEENYQFQQQKTDMLWTIGILTMPKRKEELKRLIWLLEYTMPYAYRHRIEIIVNEDNGEKSVGEKRNQILDNAKGEYISFIDDDDLIQSCYLSKICQKLDKGLYDGIGFWGRYYVSGKPVMDFNHANANNGHFKKDGRQHRPLNHLNPVRTKMARKIRFPDKNFAEDADYCDRLLASGLIKEEFVFNEVMYHYLFDPHKTETQK
jgi:hypothetical protein